MEHNLHCEGVGYRLRPVQLKDAQFIIDVRREDENRNKYIHHTSPDLADQEHWLQQYFKREGDFYFIIENKLTQDAEGLISIYDLNDDKAEWGRWVVKKGSLATTESLDLLFKVAFSDLNLKEVYCRTISENSQVISLHDSLPQLTRGTLKNFIDFGGSKYDVIEHYTTPNHYVDQLQQTLEQRSTQIFLRNLRSQIGNLEFHHIGVATDGIEAEFQKYRFLGYVREDAMFEDPEQGIRGQFITATGQPRLELLENLEGSSTLDVWLKDRIKMYHFAYKTTHIDQTLALLNQNRIRQVTTLKTSVYFKKRICFFMLSPGFLLELIEA